MATNTRIFSAVILFFSIQPFLATALDGHIEGLNDFNSAAFRSHSSSSFGASKAAVVDPEPVKEGAKPEPVLELNAANDGEPEPVDGLRLNFYQPSCPNAEQIVLEVLTKANIDDAGLAAAMVRLHTHDCFVKGCDASILLDKDPKGGPGEKTAGPNGEFIRGLDVIDEIKARLETECPNVVSCADLLTYAARDALVLSGLPKYEVPGGRRDGLSALEGNVENNLPLPDDNIDKIIDLFARKGFTPEELVVLTGAHSIGISHCGNFAYRVFDRLKAEQIDPRLIAMIRFVCTNPKDTLPFDSMSQYTMDSAYYKLLLKNRGLIESDQFMANDPKLRAFVEQFANDQNLWIEKFIAAMIKVSKIEVLTGNEGEIRKNCRVANKI